MTQFSSILFVIIFINTGNNSITQWNNSNISYSIKDKREFNRSSSLLNLPRTIDYSNVNSKTSHKQKNGSNNRYEIITFLLYYFYYDILNKIKSMLLTFNLFLLLISQKNNQEKGFSMSSSEELNIIPDNIYHVPKTLG